MMPLARPSMPSVRLTALDVPVSTTISDLVTKTTYYYKVVTITSAGTSTGELLKFTTN